ncbi:hypothetical protein N9L47_13175 [Rhodobacteraceae bacterium]|nr:hypothetical protein [Paracoccaceae bacterium]
MSFAQPRTNYRCAGQTGLLQLRLLLTQHLFALEAPGFTARNRFH